MYAPRFVHGGVFVYRVGTLIFVRTGFQKREIGPIRTCDRAGDAHDNERDVYVLIALAVQSPARHVTADAAVTDADFGAF